MSEPAYVLPAPPYNLAQARAAHVEIVRIRKEYRAMYETRVSQLRRVVRLYEESCGREDGPMLDPPLDAAEFGDENGPPKAIVGPPGWAEIHRAVMHEFCVEPEAFYGTGKRKNVVEAREFCTMLCRRLTAMSYPEISTRLGRPSHSVAVTQIQRLKLKMERDQRISDRLERLEKKIQG